MYIKCDDADVYYETQGVGIPIVLLHGNGEDHTYFIHQVPYLKALGYQVILLDMRGHGLSSLGSIPLDFHIFASDVKQILDDLHIPHANILGFSDGANTALQFTITYPTYVKSLILNAGNLNPRGVCRIPQSSIVVAYYGLLLASILNKHLEKRKQVIQLMVKHPHINVIHLENIDVPVLVIAGENDMIRAKHTQLIASSIPNAKLCVIPKGDHFIALKRSDVFNQTVGSFLCEVQENGR